MADNDDTLKEPLNPKRKPEDASSSQEIHEVEDGDTSRTLPQTGGDDGTPLAPVEPQQQHGLVKKLQDFFLTACASRKAESQTELPLTVAGIEQPPQESGFKKLLKSLVQKVRFSRAIGAADDEAAEIAGEDDIARYRNCPYRNELRGHRNLRQRIRTSVLNLISTSDNANSATVTIVVVLLGFLYTINHFVQRHGPNLAFALFCFGISLVATTIACLMALATIPPIVRSIGDLSLEDGYVNDAVERLQERTAELDFEGKASFGTMIRSTLDGRVLPSRLVWRRILVFIIFFVAVASSAAAIFRQYFKAVDRSAPGLGPSSSPSH